MIIPLVFADDEIIIGKRRFTWESHKYSKVYAYICDYFTKAPCDDEVYMPCDSRDFIDFMKRDVDGRDFLRTSVLAWVGGLHIYYSYDECHPKARNYLFYDLPGEVTIPQLRRTFKSFWAAYHALLVETADDVERFLTATTYEECQSILSTIPRINHSRSKDCCMLIVIQCYAFQHRDVLSNLPDSIENLVYVPKNRDTYWGVVNGQGKNVLGRTLKFALREGVSDYVCRLPSSKSSRF